MLTPGDAIMTAPGAPWEMEERIIDGRKLRTWKNVSWLKGGMLLLASRWLSADFQTPRSYRHWIMPKFPLYADREFLSSPLPPPADPKDWNAREHLSYAQVYDRALDCAAWMRSLGIGISDRVAIGGANSAK